MNLDKWTTKSQEAIQRRVVDIGKDGLSFKTARRKEAKTLSEK